MLQPTRPMALGRDSLPRQPVAAAASPANKSRLQQAVTAHRRAPSPSQAVRTCMRTSLAPRARAARAAYNCIRRGVSHPGCAAPAKPCTGPWAPAHKTGAHPHKTSPPRLAASRRRAAAERTGLGSRARPSAAGRRPGSPARLARPRPRRVRRAAGPGAAGAACRPGVRRACTTDRARRPSLPLGSPLPPSVLA
jgi:hypothetical protein